MRKKYIIMMLLTLACPASVHAQDTTVTGQNTIGFGNKIDSANGTVVVNGPVPATNPQAANPSQNSAETVPTMRRADTGLKGDLSNGGLSGDLTSGGLKGDLNNNGQ